MLEDSSEGLKVMLNWDGRLLRPCQLCDYNRERSGQSSDIFLSRLEGESESEENTHVDSQ